MHPVWIVLVFLFKKCSLQESSFDCGHQKIRTKDLIVNGFETFAGQFPWHAAIFHRSSRTTIEYACGGNLISDTFVLTAAHCTKDGGTGEELNTKLVVVYLGVYDRSFLNPAMFQQHSVLAIHTVESAADERWTKCRNDIALLELKTKVRYTDFVQPVCITTLEVPAGTEGVVAGWGWTEEDALSQELKASRMPIVSMIDCLMSDRDTFGQTLDSGMICAGYLNGTTVCNGDSGGGLTVNLENNTWFLVGIVSFTARNSYESTCRIDGFGVFVDVQYYLPWIINVTEQEFGDQSSLTSSSTTLPVLEENLFEPLNVTIPTNSIEDSFSPGECGRRLVEPDLSMYANRDSRRGLWPWHGTLHRKDKNSNYRGYLCGVTVLTDTYAISAQYCISRNHPVKLFVLFGQSDLNQNDNKAQRRKVIQIHDKGEEYTPIILIQLENALQFTKYVQPICLFTEDVTNQTGFIPGYGGAAQFRKTILEDDLMVLLPEEKCNFAPDDPIWLICANHTNNRPNRWDAGGGLSIREGDKWFLRGIFTIDPEIQNIEFVALIDIARFLEWIKSIIEK